MNRSWRVTPADRDTDGNIRLVPVAAAPNRTLADLLPPGETPPVPPPAAPVAWTRQRTALAATGCLLLLAALAALIVTAQPQAPVRSALTATPPATAISVSPVAPQLPRLPRALVAYAAPHGEPIGALDAGRAYTATAIYGDAWLQLDVAESGRVWVRAGDLTEARRAGLPDLSPTPAPAHPTAPPAPVVAPAPAARADCDPATAPFQVRRQLGAYGSVTGISCVSEAEAVANADQLAAEVAHRATATAGARATPTPQTAHDRGRQ